MGGGSGDGAGRGRSSEEVLREVQTIQRRSTEWRHFWDSFCDVHGDGIRDPRRHGTAFLLRFLRTVDTGSEGSGPPVVGAAPTGEHERSPLPRDAQRHERSPLPRMARERSRSRSRSRGRSRGRSRSRRRREPREEALGERTGVLEKDKGSFGFIRQDGFDETMFVMPTSCRAFGGAFPPLGTRVVFSVVTDHRTGKLRADDVRPPSKVRPTPPAPPARSQATPPLPREPPPPRKPETPQRLRGTMEDERGKYGFIRQDTCEDNMFVMPSQCVGFGGNLPPVGTRVTYVVVPDTKNGRTMADDVWPEEDDEERPRTPPRRTPASHRAWEPREHREARESPAWREPARDAPREPPPCEEFTGVIEGDKGKYGYIKQDHSEDSLIVFAPFPPVGTRVAYRAVLDSTNGKLRADEIRPISRKEAGGGGGGRRAPQPPALTPQPPAGPPPAAAAALPAPPPPPARAKRKGPRRAEGEVSGVMDRDKGSFGFILQDSDGEHLFVMPGHCEAFGESLPSVGTRVIYRIGTDPKTGRARAEDVRPEAEEEEQEGGLSEERTGVMEIDKGTFGFIKQDNGEDTLFVIPTCCLGFDDALPPLGARVVYRVGRDQRGRYLAEEVRPEAGGGGGGQRASTQELEELVEEVKAVQRRSNEWLDFWHHHCDEHGNSVYDPKWHKPPFLRHFLKLAREEEQRKDSWSQGGKGWKSQHRQENHGDSWSKHRQESRGDEWNEGWKSHHQDNHGDSWSKGGNSGKHHHQESRGDEWNEGWKSHHWQEGRADDWGKKARKGEPWSQQGAQQESRHEPWVQQRAPQARQDQKAGRSAAQQPDTEHRGVMSADKGSYGFIQEDETEERIFVMPGQCDGFDGDLPPVGTRVVYWVGEDPKSGKPRAQNVWAEESASRSGKAPPWRFKQDKSEELAGTVDADKGTYGFIVQDSGEENMFYFPPLQPVGTRVSYRLIWDPKTQRQRADEVRPLSSKAQNSSKRHTSGHPPAPRPPSPPGRPKPPARPPPPAGEREDDEEEEAPQHSGTFDADKGTFGFILQDSDQEHLFVAPRHCEGFGGSLPSVGTRVVYRLGLDHKTGKHRAEDVHPEPEGQEPVEGEERLGVFEKDKGSFGFIRDDVTGEDMFVMPVSCTGFSNELPQLGTRVRYTVFRDTKTGKLRADDIRPEAGGEEPRPPKELVYEVRAAQRRSQENKDLWRRLCDEQGGGNYNAYRQTVDLLEQFMTQVRAEEEEEERPQEPEGEAPSQRQPEQPELGADVLEADAVVPAAEPEEPPAADEEEPPVDEEEPPVDEEEPPADEEEPPAEEEERVKEEADEASGELVARALEAQADSPGVWNAFCDREGGGERDPRRHPPEFLQHFLDDIYFYVRCTAGAGGAARGKRSSREGSGSGERGEAPPKKHRR